MKTRNTRVIMFERSGWWVLQETMRRGVGCIHTYVLNLPITSGISVIIPNHCCTPSRKAFNWCVRGPPGERVAAIKKIVHAIKTDFTHQSNWGISCTCPDTDPWVFRRILDSAEKGRYLLRLIWQINLWCSRRWPGSSISSEGLIFQPHTLFVEVIPHCC